MVEFFQNSYLVIRRYIKSVFIPVAVFSLLCNVLFLLFGNTTPDGYLEGPAMFRGADWALETGRWFIRYINLSTGNVILPLLNYFLSLIFLFLTAIILIRLWRIKKRFHQALMGVSLAVAPAVTVQYLYIYNDMAFSLALLLSSLSVWILFSNHMGKVFRFIIASLCLAFSMGCYQAYVGFAAAMIVMTTIIRQLDGESPVHGLTGLLKSLLMGVCGGAVYFVILKINLLIFGKQMAEYGGADKVGIWNSLVNLPRSLFLAYKSFIDYFTTQAKFMGWILVLPMMAIGGAVLIYLLIKHKDWKKCCMVIVLVMLIPLAMNCVILIAPGREFYYVMSHQMQLTIPFVLAIGERTSFRLKSVGEIAQKISVLLAAGFCWTCVVAGYCTHYSMVFAANYNKSNVQTILTRISTITRDGDTKLLMAGEPDPSFQKANKLYKYSYYTNSTAVWSNDYGHVCEGWRQYLAKNFGYDTGIVSRKEFEDIVGSDEFQKMSLYPAKDSIKKINNIIVVKISDYEEPTELSTQTNE